MKILLYCPSYYREGKPAIWPATFQSIEALDRAGHDVDTVIDFEQPCAYIPGDYAANHENTLVKYQGAQHRAIAEGYDALLFIEHDMLVPEDALQKLSAVDGDVVYGVYLFRRARPVVNALRHLNVPNLGMSLSLFPDELATAWKREIVPVSGAGFGCTLIRKSALAQIPMRRSEGHPAPDMPFAIDCHKAGIKQMAHFGVLCGHIKPTGHILWPGLGEDDSMNVKVMVLQSVNVDVNGTGVHLEAGKEASLPDEVAYDLARAGYVRKLAQAQAVKVVNPPSKSLSHKSVKKAQK